MSKADVSSGYGIMVKCSYCLRAVTISTVFFLLGKGLEISICAKLTGKNGCPCRPSPVIIPRFCVFGKFLGYFSLNRTVPPLFWTGLFHKCFVLFLLPDRSRLFVLPRQHMQIFCGRFHQPLSLPIWRKLVGFSLHDS